MKQSEILDVVLLRILANQPTEIPAGRIFTASQDTPETPVTQTKLVLYHEPATSAITTLGSDEVCRRRERGGIVRGVILTPLQQNTDTLGMIIGEKLRDLFEGRAADAPLHYDNVTVRSTGRDGTSAWVTNLVITYRLDEVK